MSSGTRPGNQAESPGWSAKSKKAHDASYEQRSWGEAPVQNKMGEAHTLLNGGICAGSAAADTRPGALYHKNDHLSTANIGGFLFKISAYTEY